MRTLLASLLSVFAAHGAESPATLALRILPYDVPAGCERGVYFNPEGSMREIELTPNNPSLRFRVAAAAKVMLYEPPSAELTARLKARLAEEGRPNAPVRYTPDLLTPLAEITLQAPAEQALAVLFPTGREKPKLLGYAMSDQPGRFRPGCRRIFNLTQRVIGGQFGNKTVELKPLSAMDVGPIADGDQLVFVPIEIWCVKDGARQLLTASRWAHDPKLRTVVFLYEDLAEGRVRVQACAERTDLPEPGQAPAAAAEGFGSTAVKRRQADMAAAKPADPAAGQRPLTEAELAEQKARESVDSTNFILPRP